MKLIEWNCFNEIEAYTTCREDHGRIMNMSFNGIDDQQVLENRQRLAKTLHSDLSQMVATYNNTLHVLLKSIIVMVVEECGVVMML